jgi:hypothetical protein
MTDLKFRKKMIPYMEMLRRNSEDLKIHGKPKKKFSDYKIPKKYIIS